MLLAPHAVSGAAVGLLTRRPVLAIPAAVITHFLLDTVPHWQETLPPYTPHRGTALRVPLDIGIAVILVRAMTRAHPTSTRLLWISAVAGILPDFDFVQVLLPGLRKSELVRRYVDWHVGLQNETSSLWGLAPQIGVILAGLAVARLANKPTP